MNLIKFIKSAFAAAKDPNRDFSERVFLILTLVSEITVTIAFVGDLITGENTYELITLVAVLIAVPLIVLLCLYYEKLKFAMHFIVLSLVFFILPALFFFGGGLEGGGVIWIIFAFTYIGITLKGKWRNVMFTLLTLLTLGCYLAAYYLPELVYQHSREMFFVDSFISLILVGILCFVMNWSQGLIFSEENARAKKETERAEELTRAQNRFFSSMSHEIRTPINSILGLNELILRDQEASDEIIKDASGIQGSGKMLLALINDILDFSKMEAGSMDIVPVDYRIGDMLSEIVNMLWLKAHEKGLGFDISVDPEVPMVLYGDEVRIKQVIINLLNNAVKYTKSGHVGLHVESRDADEDTVELMISISDTGMGIKKEDLPYLFDAFKRVDEGKNRHIEGTGLGLSIVKQLVELMGGSVTVSSVYGEGSTFTVQLKQKVSDHKQVGELNIHNQQVSRRGAYESSFLAPEARILIVDDNEMNLEVERRLLEDTDMAIDKALSGKEALNMCQKVHYDTIFMDHLMPEMDGIECLSLIRDQAGGLNRNTPVIVLTANAGSENRDLYNRAGFDGYLVKPVSGQAMEEMLIRHIPSEKVILRNAMTGDDEAIHTSDRYAEKAPVIVTASNMCDLPDTVVRKLHIPIIPFRIRTEEGIFKDGVHMDAHELIRHVNSGKEATSLPQDEAAYTEFFADALKKAHHLIHISLTTSMSKEYQIASEAAKSFDNVTVINSEGLSSSTGLLVLIAYKLMQQGLPARDIIEELEQIKHRLRCSFVIDTTEYMAKRGLISQRLNKLARSLNLHLSLRIRNDKTGIGGLWLGSTKRAHRKYIHKALPVDTIPDADVVFVTYVDIPEETLLWIEEEIKKTAYFERVVFQQASAAISSNCGPGTFGILYFLKSNKSYNLASYFEDMTAEVKAQEDESDAEDQEEELLAEVEESSAEEASEEVMTPAEVPDVPMPEDDDPEAQWYKSLSCIDTRAAINNSGSAEAFKAVLKIFYDSIQEKYDELQNFYNTEDWENYTIKIHALKSSARLVGALELGDAAQLLETAGKAGDISFIQENHSFVLDDYLTFREVLAPVFAEAEAGKEAGDEKPLADEYLMESIYEGLKEAADAMDCDMVEAILKEIEGYAIPDPEAERFSKVREKAEALDYDGLKEALG
ncbi:MAG: DegV family EDD domain-containing protein [Lachnospiraceae bacterium]|nr:DegV family EDD domain-containing protein [Lachnospiraceae bacterium]